MELFLSVKLQNDEERMGEISILAYRNIHIGICNCLVLRDYFQKQSAPIFFFFFNVILGKTTEGTKNHSHSFCSLPPATQWCKEKERLLFGGGEAGVDF